MKSRLTSKTILSHPKDDRITAGPVGLLISKVTPSNSKLSSGQIVSVVGITVGSTKVVVTNTILSQPLAAAPAMRTS